MASRASYWRPLPERDWAALIVQVAVNLAPLVLIAAGAADAGNVLMFYWIETLVIAVYGTLYVLLAPQERLIDRLQGAAGIPVFWFAFCAWHPIAFENSLGIEVRVDDYLWMSAALLAVSHGIPFVRNYMRGGAAFAAAVENAALAAGARIFFIFITLLVIGLVFREMDAREAGIVVLISLKISAELALDYRAQRSA